MRRLLFIGLFLCVAVDALTVVSPVFPQDPRRTPTVVAAEAAVPSVVQFYIVRSIVDGSTQGSLGAGTLIDSRGYVLTVAHLFNGSLHKGSFALMEGVSQRLPIRLVNVLPEKDLALVQIKLPDDAPAAALALGRSHDLMLGEPVLAVGNPRGVGLTLSQGIVSGFDRRIGTPTSVIEHAIQFTAAINPGNSGGPMVNALGQQIGVVAQGNPDGEGIGFGISIDEIRSRMRRLVRPEYASGYDLGLELDPLSDPPTIQTLKPDGPAEMAGLQVGDQITTWGQFDLEQSHALLLRWSELSEARPVTLTILRDGERQTIEVQSTPRKQLAAADVDRDSLSPGLAYAAFTNGPLAADAMLDGALSGEPDDSGRIRNLAIAAIKPQDDQFGIRYSGFLDFPKAGLWRLQLTSDDGSRLKLDDEVVIDIDGGHPPVSESCEVDVAEGLQRFVLDYFELSGEEYLTLRWKHESDASFQDVPASAWFMDAP